MSEDEARRCAGQLRPMTDPFRGRPAPLPGVSLDDPDLTRAVAEAIHEARCCRNPWGHLSNLVDLACAGAALAAVRAHLEEVGR